MLTEFFITIITENVFYNMLVVSLRKMFFIL